MPAKTKSDSSSVPNPNAFIGRPEAPTEADLETALGPTKPVWDALIADLATQHDVTVHEWKSYSAKSGWALRLLRKKRTIVWLTPCTGYLLATFILGDKALHAAREGTLPANARQALDQAQKYPEGTGVRLEIKGPKDIPAVKKLAIAKLQN